MDALNEIKVLVEQFIIAESGKTRIPVSYDWIEGHFSYPPQQIDQALVALEIIDNKIVLCEERCGERFYKHVS